MLINKQKLCYFIGKSIEYAYVFCLNNKQNNCY